MHLRRGGKHRIAQEFPRSPPHAPQLNRIAHCHQFRRFPSENTKLKKKFRKFFADEWKPAAHVNDLSRPRNDVVPTHPVRPLTVPQVRYYARAR